MMDKIFTYFSSLPPKCPNITQVTNYVQFPSVAVFFFLISVTSLFLALIIGIKYNSVKIFNKKIRTSHISNTLWIYYFVCTSLRGATDCIRYILPTRIDGKTGESVFFLTSLAFHGFTSLALTLALNHQKRFRSTVIPQPEKENDPLLERYSRIKNSISYADILFIFLFILYCSFLAVLELNTTSKPFELAFLALFGLQHLPILLLSFIITISKNPTINEGPSTSSRIYLMLGSLFNVAGDLPISIWSYILPNTCVFYVASWIDIFHVLYLISLFLYFLFLRSEYFRNQEEAVWSTVSKIQDTDFDFRKFSN